jgi:hypothetical protein
MAREKNKAFGGPEEQEEMTVVIVRFKGGGDTLRKGFDTVSQALAALGPAVPVPAARRLVSPRHEDQALMNGGDVAEDANGLDPEEAAVEGENGDGITTRHRPTSPREYTMPKFLDDLNLSPDGQTPWKEYAAAKNPQMEADKYLVACGWLTECGGITEFTVNHIFTCFRAMEWKMPKDSSYALRNMKQRKSYFDNPGRGIWKLTSIGLDEAKSLPRNAA